MILPERDKEYFEHFRVTPLELMEFDPRSKVVADKHIQQIEQELDDESIEVMHRGSTAFGILGKGDIDIAVYTDNEKFSETCLVLSRIYGDPNASGEEFASFAQQDHGYEVEISLMKGNEAETDKALTQVFFQSTELLQEYVELKRKYCYSKREYLIQRDKFFRRILSKI